MSKQYEVSLIEKIKNSSNLVEATEHLLKFFDGRDIPFIREYVEKLLLIEKSGLLLIKNNQQERFDIDTKDRFKGLLVLQLDNQLLYALNEPLDNTGWVQVDIGDKFPQFTGQANKLLSVNSSATQIEFTSLDQVNQFVQSKIKFTYNQLIPTNEWTINHNLGLHPSVSVVDSAGTKQYGEVQYITNNQIKIKFSAPFSGKAYLN